LAVAAFLERLAVVGAGDGDGVSLGSGLLDGVSSDVEELLPADDSSPPSSLAGSGHTSGSPSLDHDPPTTDAPAIDAPPCTVIFGMSPAPSSTCSVLPHCGHRTAPTE